MSNERSHERVPVRNIVQIAYPQQTHHEVEYLNNISNGGLGFRSQHPWQDGEKVHVILQTDETFDIPAIVRWCRPQNGFFEVGVEFLTPPGDVMMASLCEMDSTLAMYQATAMSP